MTCRDCEQTRSGHCDAHPYADPGVSLEQRIGSKVIGYYCDADRPLAEEIGRLRAERDSLAERLRRAEEENERMRRAVADRSKVHDSDLVEENARLREALGFYAAEDHWEGMTAYHCVAEADNGAIAQSVLGAEHYHCGACDEFQRTGQLKCPRGEALRGTPEPA